MSDYEKQRMQRIAENEEVFKQLFPVSPLRTPRRQNSGKIKPSSENSRRSPRTKPYSVYPTRRNPSRHCRGRRKVHYGSDCEEQDRSSDYDPEDDETCDRGEDFKPAGLVVKLWGNKARPYELQAERKRRFVSFVNIGKRRIGIRTGKGCTLAAVPLLYNKANKSKLNYILAMLKFSNCLQKFCT